ncbi:MAG: UDP-N-acetylmuramate dehydrogenase [Acidobacteria bacterium]|nr:UDP-N-acetylmuramate dehydrogenase [Acidobacteriota bacterium]
MEFSPFDIQQNVALGPLTTLGVGGTGRYFVKAESVEKVRAAVHFAEVHELPLLVIGGASNLVISDLGWPGLVLEIAIDGIRQCSSAAGEIFEVGAGVDWDRFVAESVSGDFGGIECLSGIPGRVGATPVQNVGAYGQEVSETIVSLLVFDRTDNRVRTLSAAECHFAYRKSIFNSDACGRYIILQVDYRLSRERRSNLRYRDLEHYFAGQPTTPTLREIRKAVCEIRAAKGMLIDPGDPESRSVGSFFKNPVLSDVAFARLQGKAQERKLRVPSYPALARQKKISAAWLVENSGFSKGYRRGRVGLSQKHALAIVNRGGATADEVIGLKDEIQHAVEQTWGIQLDPEPVLVGF